MPAKQVVISVNSEHKCEEEVKLLDACLAALSEEESTKKAARLRAATTSEVAVAHAQLITARDRYWKHVVRHKCRVVKGVGATANAD